MGRIRHQIINDANGSAFEAPIAALERGITYPLGDDRFEIDHGEDYFAFFRRLGTLNYYIAQHGERVVAVAAAVLRTFQDSRSGRRRRAWYLGDLKVHPEFRRRSIPRAMFLRHFLPAYVRCPRGYGISMNPSDGSENPVTRLARRLPFVPISADHTLGIVSLDAAEMALHQPLIEEHRGPVRYLSLEGIKDIVLQSTGEPMPLLHVQTGPYAEGNVETPQEGHTHMFCGLLDDPLLRQLSERGVHPQATATIFHHRMKGFDWSSVLTSDI